MKKKISIAQIQSGALLGAPVAITVCITLEGEECEFDAHIKPFSYATVVARWKAVGESKEALAGTIASCICDDKGELLFTEDQVREKFSDELIEALWQKIYDVNNIAGKLKTKNSEKMNSLQNSPLTVLEEIPLQPLSKISPTVKLDTGVDTKKDEVPLISAEE